MSRPHCSAVRTAIFQAGVCLLLAFGTFAASAQAVSTASRKNAIDVFAGGTYLNPDFGTKRDTGFTVGGDFTHHFRIANVALDARYTSTSGEEADENIFLGGVKISRDYRRYHPYINVLIGHGVIKFDHPEVFGFITYTHDDSTVYDGGGGLDYDISRHFAVKVEGQYQTWRIGKEVGRFTPSNVTVGVVYRIPYQSLRH